jgi:hypothetical protein
VVKWKRAECDQVEKNGENAKKKKENQRSRILQAFEYKTSYTLEDGHVGRNM